jgi:WD40 repeat protein
MCSDADHAGYRVKSFAASADCRLAVIVLFDSTVAVWDMGSMECICMLQSWGDRDAARVHSAGVNAAYLTPTGSRAVTVSGDHTARVWDVATAECKFVLRGMMPACWHARVRSCILCAERCTMSKTKIHPCYTLLLGIMSNEHRLQPMTAIVPVCPLVEQQIVRGGLLCSGHDDSISMGCLDGAGRRLLTVAFDKTARVWDIRTGRSLAVLQHQQQLVRGCMAPHGHTAVTVTADHVAHLWDVRSGQVLHAFEVRNPLFTAKVFRINGDSDVSAVLPIMCRQMHASLHCLTFHWNSSVMAFVCQLAHVRISCSTCNCSPV